MGKVLPFSGPLEEETAASRKLKNGVWRMVNLRGQRPKGHPIVYYTRLGKVILAKYQVWVGTGDELWQVRELYPNQRSAFYHHDVALRHYRKRGPCDIMSEHNLRYTMRVWDVAHKERAGVIDKLVLGARSEGFKANAEGVQSFFGLDRYGNRVD